MFHQPLLHLFMENIRLWDHAGQISLPVRLQDQNVAEAQEMLTAEHTCLLLVSLLSVLSHDECSAKGMGNGCMERVREQKMLEIKESAGGSREVFPTT